MQTCAKFVDLGECFKKVLTCKNRPRYSGERASQSFGVLNITTSKFEPIEVHTKIGRDLDAKGDIVDPVIAEWATGGVFVTPPGSTIHH